MPDEFSTEEFMDTLAKFIDYRHLDRLVSLGYAEAIWDEVNGTISFRASAKAIEIFGENFLDGEQLP